MLCCDDKYGMYSKEIEQGMTVRQAHTTFYALIADEIRYVRNGVEINDVSEDAMVSALNYSSGCLEIAVA